MRNKTTDRQLHLLWSNPVWQWRSVFYLRDLYLFLELADQVIFVLFLHPAQVYMTLNLLIVFLTLVNFGFLLSDLELELLCLELILGYLFLQFSFLQTDVVFGDRLIIGHLLDPTLARLRSELSLGKGAKDVWCHCVDMKLCLTGQTADTKVSCLVLWV